MFWSALGFCGKANFKAEWLDISEKLILSIQNNVILIIFIECKNWISVVRAICHSHNYYCVDVPPNSTYHEMLIQAKASDARVINSFIVKVLRLNWDWLAT